MRRNTKVAFGGIMAAVCTVCMLLSYFPYFTYAAPGIASLFIMVALIETNKKWALGVYIASAVMVLIFAESESRFIYVLFFGHYPILKAIFEGYSRGVWLWLQKLFSFNVSAVLIYFITSLTVGISIEEFSVLGRYGAVVFLVIANGVFVVYDIALSRMAWLYISRFHNTVKNMLKF